jgi:hypothetical protein
LDTRPRSLRVKAPRTKWFGVRGISHTERLAPGLSHTFEVVFNGQQLDGAGNPGAAVLHDSLSIACQSVGAQQQEPVMEVWLHARPPAPRLSVSGDLQFGVVAVGAQPSRQLQLSNTGSAAAAFNVTWDDK